MKSGIATITATWMRASWIVILLGVGPNLVWAQVDSVPRKVPVVTLTPRKDRSLLRVETVQDPAPPEPGREVPPLDAPAMLPERPAAVGMDGRADDWLQAIGDPTATVDLVVGRSRIFNARKPLTRIVVANPGIADVHVLDAEQPNPKLIELMGLAFGTTQLTLWDNQNQAVSFLVRVEIDTKELEQRLSKVFPGADVKVRQVGSQVILEGQVPDAKTMAEVLQLVESVLQGGPVRQRGGGNAAAAPAGGNQPAAASRGLSRDSGVQRAAFQQVPPPFGPGGPPFSPLGPPGGDQETTTSRTIGDANDQTTVQTVQQGGSPQPRSGGGSLAAGTIINRVHVPGPRQVLLHVKLAELNRTAIRQLGISFLDAKGNDVVGQTIGGVGAIGASITPLPSPLPNRTVTALANSLVGTQPQLFGIFDAGNFTIFLNALRQNDIAKILAEPNLVTLDGQPARFQAGGSFPFPVPQTTSGGGTVITIQFRDFGAILQFLPHILDGDAIRLDVAPVFSRLNNNTGTTVAGTTVPGLDERSARTVVEMREGQTLAIAGLLQSQTNATTARIPGLGDIPVLGQLFSRNSITTIETELIVLVTPELIEPVDAGEVPPTAAERLQEPNDYEFYFLGRIEGKTRHPHRATVQELDPYEIMKHVRSDQRWVVGPHGHAE